METPPRIPRVGVSVMIFKDGKILMSKRKASHGAGEYAFPGGHLEHLESFEECARRETMEEAGIEIGNVRFLRLYNMTEYAPKHYVHVSLVADWVSGEPKNCEPDVQEPWEWHDPERPPAPVFASVRGDLEALKTGRNYYDS